MKIADNQSKNNTNSSELKSQMAKGTWRKEHFKNESNSMYRNIWWSYMYVLILYVVHFYGQGQVELSMAWILWVSIELLLMPIKSHFLEIKTIFRTNSEVRISKLLTEFDNKTWEPHIKSRLTNLQENFVLIICHAHNIVCICALLELQKLTSFFNMNVLLNLKALLRTTTF